MDESDEKEDIQSERLKYQLLIGLKTTVEGLLSTNPTNVWGMYGGLPRLCKHMDSILNHRLKMVVGDYGSTVDYWPFVKGLKWLNPVMTPFIEKIRKGHYPKGDSKGQVWVRESLREHKLSMQLKVLVSNEQHMYRHYFEDAFLFNADYFKAMCLCLQAVEDNRVSLLADIDPKLLNFSAARVVPTHIFRRTSLPKSSPNKPTSSKKIGSRVKSSDLSALAPHFVSPSRESLLSSSLENAVSYNLGSSTSPEDNQQLAREALRTVLKKSGSISDSLERPSPNHASEFDLYKSINEDPLSNLALLKDDSGGSNLEPSLQVIKVKKINLTRSESESGVARKVKSQRAAEMVEKIIHEDNVFSLSKSTETLVAGASSKKIRFEDPVRDIFSDSETVEAKGKLNGDKQKRVRPTHKRSRSDIIGGKNLALQKEILEDDEEAKPNANSNGNADHVDGKPDGMFSVPQQGQSILNYLSQQEFHTCANLEKENAHFSICEALIAAIEQMKWNHLISPSRGACGGSRGGRE
ncbi:hypothetical protein DPMN_108448 [Dreissena polymorpha]|uniref:RUN domain-containing protein n=1 Tax=Dreissena polymorpha TaxID=45954 RepID=A0A9D4K8V4_DREPO|nr:hypothetical protein DPMN_108448 [Dreissena polymorpha]